MRRDGLVAVFDVARQIDVDRRRLAAVLPAAFEREQGVTNKTAL